MRELEGGDIFLIGLLPFAVIVIVLTIIACTVSDYFNYKFQIECLKNGGRYYVEQKIGNNSTNKYCSK